jgi:hypothetical protein
LPRSAHTVAEGRVTMVGLQLTEPEAAEPEIKSRWGRLSASIRRVFALSRQ